MTESNNDHVRSYLDYYLKLPHSPYFAVLISGPWGVGKTYLLKEFLQNFSSSEKDRYIYVSLYGLSTIEEIDDALLQAVFPTLMGNTAKIVGKIATAGLRYFKIDFGIFQPQELLNKFSAKIFVFDDLERCEAPINKVLGYINQFVEHNETRVIILANEMEISKDEDYRRRREKLIGKTLEVQSAFAEAFNYFLSKISDAETRICLNSNLESVRLIYTQSELNNLRILQQTMWDFERFYEALLPKHRENTEAVSTLLRLLFVMSFEFKAARIGESDLKFRNGWAVAVAKINKDAKANPILSISDRYPLVDPCDDIISNEILIDYLVRGVISANAIQSQLNASRFFVSGADEEAWRTVWHWTERPEDVFNKAVEKLEDQFVNRYFTRDGEILHVFGLRLFLSKIGILKKNRSDLMKEGKTYLDDVYKANVLQFSSTSGEYTQRGFEGWGGLGIHENETAEYKELFIHLAKIRQHIIEDAYPQQAINLLGEMKIDVQHFYRELCPTTDDSKNTYAYIPLLSKLDPDAFVDALLELQPSNQRIVMMMFKSRYECDRLERELKDEKEWAQIVKTKLLSKTEAAQPITRYRLGRLIEQNMDFTPA